MVVAEDKKGPDRARTDISHIFEGIGGDSGDAGDKEGWAPPTAKPVEGPPPEAGAPHAGPPGSKNVLDIFDFSPTPERIPPPAAKPAPPAAVPMAAPVVTTEKKKVAPPPGSTRKEKAPSVEELTALADDAYDNYNFPQAARHIKQAMTVDDSFPPAQELFGKLLSEHPHLFDDDGAPRTALTAPEDPDVNGEGEHQDVTPRPTDPESAPDKSKGAEETIEKRDIGETGLVMLRSGIVEKKVYTAPRTTFEDVRADEKKGYRNKGGIMSSKGAMVGLLMGVVGLAIIIFALWYTGMMEF